MVISHKRPRGGFTLIEILVVLALIATLLALTAGAFFRVRAGQIKAASEATLQKLNTALDNRMKTIQESVNEDARKNQGQWPFALAAANGDPDVAKSLLMYAKVKNELPMTFAEAKAPTIVITSTGTITLPARANFSVLPNSTANSPEESGACFYIAVLTSGGGGAMTDQDGLQQQSSDFTGASWNISARVFKDAWGTPIAFVRHAYTAELNASPFLRGGNRGRDSFDPASKFNVTTLPPATWTQIRGTPPAFINVNVPPAYNYNTPADFTRAPNHVSTLISAGPDKLFTTGTYDAFAGTNNDNLLSYRLRREGAKGD